MENLSKPASLQRVYEYRPLPGLDAAATAATSNGRGLGLDLGLLGHGLGLDRALVDGLCYRTEARDVETGNTTIFTSNSGRRARAA